MSKEHMKKIWVFCRGLIELSLHGDTNVSKCIRAQKHREVVFRLQRCLATALRTKHMSVLICELVWRCRLVWHRKHGINPNSYTCTVIPKLLKKPSWKYSLLNNLSFLTFICVCVCTPFTVATSEQHSSQQQRCRTPVSITESQS